MADNTAEERRRLSAAWLNIVAAGLVSAGVAHSLVWVAAEGWGERARSPSCTFGIGYVLGGFGLHLFARTPIPRGPPQSSPRQGNASQEQTMNDER
jgi:hypothetical protein